MFNCTRPFNRRELRRVLSNTVPKVESDSPNLKNSVTFIAIFSFKLTLNGLAEKINSVWHKF